MPSTSAPRPPMPLARRWASGFADLAATLATPRCGSDELSEARELLSYWEQRSRRLPRWAVMRRREARRFAARWRVRLREAEEARYGRGVLGVASQFAIERRMPSTMAHRGRQAARLAAYTALTVSIALLLVVAAAVVMVAEAVHGLL